MLRIDLDALRKDIEARNKKYVWEKPLIIGGRIIQSIWKTTERKGEENA
jgi:hypothetical protein